MRLSGKVDNEVDAAAICQGEHLGREVGCAVVNAVTGTEDCSAERKFFGRGGGGDNGRIGRLLAEQLDSCNANTGGLRDGRLASYLERTCMV